MKKQNLKKNNILKIENASLLIATKALDDGNIENGYWEYSSPSIFTKSLELETYLNTYLDIS